MRRLLAIGVVLACVALAALVGGAARPGQPVYRVNAVFDNASSLEPGNLVKIAGAEVGKIKDIKLTRRRQALVEMEIEQGYAPFRSDARCLIAPESLFIGEKFVQCLPGTPRGKPLTASGGKPGTVPLERNSATVDLDLVLSTLRLPVRQRLTLLFNELGAGLAGRPRDLSAAIRRANPALQKANRVLRVLDEDRATLERLVDNSDAVLAELAGRTERVQSFVDHADQVTRATANRRDDLQEAVRRLPPLLDELEPSADRLAAFARQATPALRDLRGAAPAVTTLLRDVRPLSRAGRPALRALGRTARVGRSAVKPARPVARRLGRATRRLPAVVGYVDALAASLRSSGAIEGLQSFIYYTVLATSRFDRTSHILPAFGLMNDCIKPATTPNPSCDAHYGGVGAASARSQAKGARRKGAREAPDASAPAPSGQPVPPARPNGPAPPPAPDPRRGRPGTGVPNVPLPRVPGRRGDRLEVPLLDYLLGR